MSVYVIESDEAVRRGVCFLLNVNGFRTRAYGCGEEFLRDERPYGNSCVVTDQRMSGLTGLQIAAQLRREGNPVPVILFTGEIRPSVIADATRLGAVIIDKTSTASALIDQIKAISGSGSEPMELRNGPLARRY